MAVLNQIRRSVRGCAGRTLAPLTILGLLVAEVIVGGCAPATSTPPPASWTPVKGSRFVFYVPPDMKRLAVKPDEGDSEPGACQSNRIALRYEYGLWPDPLTEIDKPDLHRAMEFIDGRYARIVWFHNPRSGHPFDHAIAVHFPTTSEPGNKLTLFVTCQDPADYETVRLIFRTVRFK